MVATEVKRDMESIMVEFIQYKTSDIWDLRKPTPDEVELITWNQAINHFALRILLKYHFL